MHIFERELRNLLGNRAQFKGGKVIGRAFIAQLNPDVRLKVNFATGMISGHYNRLILSVINRTEGKVDTTTLLFEDYFGKVTIGDNYKTTTPYIWADGDETEWYGVRPNPREWAALGDAVVEYADIFK